jgi:hypothetical protein
MPLTAETNMTQLYPQNPLVEPLLSVVAQNGAKCATFGTYHPKGTGYIIPSTRDDSSCEYRIPPPAGTGYGHSTTNNIPPPSTFGICQYGKLKIG